MVTFLSGKVTKTISPEPVGCGEARTASMVVYVDEIYF
ncbi:MAG: hypothetical protein ACI8P9_002197 [Parasphingorhabdus sp.]|jgi:hypothetical protein